MSQLMAATQPPRNPSAQGPSAASPQSAIPVPQYPVGSNPHYYSQSQNGQDGRPSQRTQQSQQQPATPQQGSGSPQDTRRSRTMTGGTAAAAGAQQAGSSRKSQTGGSNQPQQTAAGPSGTTGRPSTAQRQPGAGGSRAGGAGGGAGVSGRQGSPSEQQRRPSESSRNPRLLEASGQLPTSTMSAATAPSPFPHAFERWEMLSSQWEGLTRYWIRRLEQHQEEISRDPLGVQMSRNITDLSAAGANLFHAVVELQRLRASSERKFQRWFFETRADQERSREMTSELENTLRNERQKRADAMATISRLEKEKSTADKLVEEVRRELQISREEARRAWEELGRREQEERERTNSLRGGHPTLVGGVQVLPMPMPGVPNRSGSVSSRPQGSGSQQYSQNPSIAAQVQPAQQPTGPMQDVNHPISPEYSQDALSEDYVGQGEQGYRAPALHHEPHLPEVPSPPPQSTGQYTHGAVSPFAPDPPQSAAAGPSGAFYQQTQPATLHPPPERTFSPGEESVVSQPGLHRPSSAVSVSISAPSDDEMGGDSWEHDIHGNILRNAQGLPIRRQTHQDSAQYEPASEAYYQHIQQQQQQQQTGQYYDPHLQQGAPPQQYQGQPQQYQGQPQYPQGAPPQQYPPGQEQQQYPPGQQQPPSDPASVAAGGWGPGWEAMGSRHQHPTRLSEIIEEEERTHTSLSGDDDRGVIRRG